MLAELSASLWAASPQRACHAIDAWASQNLLSGRAIARWAFQAPGFQSLDDELAVSIAWTALTAAVQRHETVLAVGACLLQPPLLLPGAVWCRVTALPRVPALGTAWGCLACLPYSASVEDCMPNMLSCRGAPTHEVAEHEFWRRWLTMGLVPGSGTAHAATHRPRVVISLPLPDPASPSLSLYFETFRSRCFTHSVSRRFPLHRIFLCPPLSQAWPGCQTACASLERLALGLAPGVDFCSRMPTSIMPQQHACTASTCCTGCVLGRMHGHAIEIDCDGAGSRRGAADC